MLSLSIIIPIYNEEKIILKNFNIINNFFKKSNIDYEILIIESGSTDNSKNICQNLLKNTSVKLYSQQKREGWGSALKLGYNKSTKKFISFIFKLSTRNG